MYCGCSFSLFNLDVHLKCVLLLLSLVHEQNIFLLFEESISFNKAGLFKQTFK